MHEAVNRVKGGGACSVVGANFRSLESAGGVLARAGALVWNFKVRVCVFDKQNPIIIETLDCIANMVQR